ncbi:MAG: GGDEF domain-containing protein [Halieaceae bacterium]|nr:GGDEF domain-containing protein [Halieaceae bacterium]
MEEIYVRDLMSTNVEMMAPTLSLGEVAGAMVEQSKSCMIIGQNKHPLGIVTERDLARVLVGSQHELGLMKRPVADFMSYPVLTVNQDESLYEAVVVARSERVRHLPVVDDDDNIVGIVTHRDLANAHFHVIEIQAAVIEKSIARQTRELLAANRELQAMSMEDHLLDIGNRRAMEVDLAHTHAAFLRYGRPYGVVMLDVDYFKRYNDHHGHNAGDQALQLVASFLKDEIRGTDRLYRYGGEELLLLLPEATPELALRSAWRLVNGLEECEIPHGTSPDGKMTISAGAAAIGPDDHMESWQALVELADRGLYAAKDAGRNRAVLNLSPRADHSSRRQQQGGKVLPIKR